MGYCDDAGYCGGCEGGYCGGGIVGGAIVGGGIVGEVTGPVGRVAWERSGGS